MNRSRYFPKVPKTAPMRTVVKQADKYITTRREPVLGEVTIEQFRVCALECGHTICAKHCNITLTEAPCIYCHREGRPKVKPAPMPPSPEAPAS